MPGGIPSAIGKQVESTKASNPIISFTSAPARGIDVDSKSTRTGPGSYAVRSTLGRHPTMKSPGYMKMGTASTGLTGQDSGNDVGPNTYDSEKMNRALRRSMSTSRKAPTIKFGKSRRPDYASDSNTNSVKFLSSKWGGIGNPSVLSTVPRTQSINCSSRTKLVGDRAPKGLDSPAPTYAPSFESGGPTMLFGSAPRGSESKLADGPGPGAFSIKSVTIGKQSQSTFRSSPSATLLGGRDKFGSPLNVVADAESPGPGAYRLKSSTRVNHQESSPSVTIAARWREKKQRSSSRGGPGAYQIPGGLGRQLLSTSKSASAMKFGASNRPVPCGESGDVGPGEYKVDISADKQHPLSTYKSPKPISFTKASQRPQESITSQTPGPNRYSVKSRYGHQYCSNRRSSPSPSLSGRTKFGSIFG